MFKKLLMAFTAAALAGLLATSASAAEKYEKATFAGGCFWCMEPPFEKLEGVKGAVSGYTGGHAVDPAYKEVSSGTTGHVEAVRVTYDPEAVSYEELLEVYWRQVDPTDAEGQFVDRGEQYATAVFYHNEEQRQAAEESKRRLDQSGLLDEPVVTPIREAGPFYRAEEYHQDYYKKRPLRYKFYRYNSGRDDFLEKVWADAPGPEERILTGESKDPEGRKEGRYMKAGDEELRDSLTPLQYRVTQEDATERAFDNEYWDNKREGIYVDVVSGEPLFSSRDKFVSGTGWPSFTRPLEPENIVEKEDRGWFAVRTEVRSKHGDSHLGHVFEDGPPPTGLRYCMNSASLRFIPKEKLDEEGYGEYAPLFEGGKKAAGGE